MKKDVFIGGAWPYANYLLHTRYLAALLPGDVLAKYYREKGDNVIYISGSDCYGTPITERAKVEGKTPAEIATYYHAEFEKTFERMGFEFDKFSSTMDKKHHKYVQDQLIKLVHNKCMYQKNIKQDFCETCNHVLSDREIVGICPYCGEKSSGDQCSVCSAPLNSNEVVDKHCKVCGSETITKDITHLYFKLTAFESDIRDLIEKRSDTWRKNALVEAQKYVDMGLADRIATRTLDWGIKVPFVGYEDKRVYVWIDALLGYFSLGKEVAETRGINFDEFMSDSNPNLVTYYVHGKDNIQFHTVIFPAIIKGLSNNYRLPDYMISSAFVSLDDEKNNTSSGNLITINELLELFDKDTLRFYFLYNGPEENNVVFSIDEMIDYHNNYLVGKIDYFITRTLKKFNRVIPKSNIDEKIIGETKNLYLKVGSFLERGKFKNAIHAILEYVDTGNAYYDAMQPWIQINTNLELFNDTLYTEAYMIANLANLIHPILPGLSEHIRELFDTPEFQREEISISKDIDVKNQEPKFKKIEEKERVEIGLKVQEMKNTKRIKTTEK